jgi:hypothetical protein
MPKDFPKQDSRQAVGLPASGKGNATVRKHAPGGRVDRNLMGGKTKESSGK